MRIGEFAKKYQLKKETVRYYTDLRLLTPVKYRTLYDYGESCEREIELILELKALGFSLREIEVFLTKKRFSTKDSEQFNQYSLDFFQEKRKEVQSKKKQLDDMINKLNNKIDTIIENEKTIVNKTFGLPLPFANELYCPRCRKRLALKDGKVEDSKIVEGQLRCDCGYSAAISDGILIFEGSFLGELKEAKPELTQKPITSEYASCATATTNWIIEQVKQNNLENKTLMDIRTMGGTFDCKLLEALQTQNADFQYIALDPNLENTRELKEKIVHKDFKQDVVLCSGDYSQMPFLDHSVDLMVSFLGFQALAIYHKQLPMQKICDLLKKGGKWYGVSFWVENSRSVNEKYKFMRDWLLKEAVQSKFDLFKTVKFVYTGKTDNPGEISFYFKDGAEIFFNAFKAENHRKNGESPLR